MLFGAIGLEPSKSGLPGCLLWGGVSAGAEARPLSMCERRKNLVLYGPVYFSPGGGVLTGARCCVAVVVADLCPLLATTFEHYLPLRQLLAVAHGLEATPPAVLTIPKSPAPLR